MKIRGSRHDMTGNASECFRVLEILHTEGLESAEAWIDNKRMNVVFDEIEEAYLSTKRIIYIN